MQLQNYNCICTQYALTVDVPLHLVPRRKTDSSFILNQKSRICKLNSNMLNSILIVKRASGYEKQVRYSCFNCSSLIAYTQNNNFIYIIDQAVIQGNVIQV